MTDRVAYAAAALALAFALGLSVGRADTAMPTCHEDEVIVGIGEFESGTWSAYTCGPAADDYVGA